MSFKDHFTNLAQSRWLKEFFKKYPRLKPEMYYAWVKFLKDEYEFAKHLGDLEFMLEGENLCEYSGDFYPAYLLSQLEGILPDEIKHNGKKWCVSKDFITIDGIRTTHWFYDYCDYIPKIKIQDKMVDMASFHPLTICDRKTSSSLQNLIELIKWLDEKGCFGKGEM